MNDLPLFVRLASMPMQPLLLQLSESLQNAKSEEELVRPMLRMVQEVTHLESAYLTQLDVVDNQVVQYSHNSQSLCIPEGWRVPWEDSLCRRAFEQGVTRTSQVPSTWSEVEAAKDAGIQSFISIPVHLSDGSLYGTLCAASTQEHLPPIESEAVMQLFAQLIAQHIERERLLQQLQKLSMQLADMVQTDALTQLPNRMGLLQELRRLLARAQRDGGAVWVAVMDLDGFKAINDTYGHLVGDRLLQLVAQRLGHMLRDGDVVARMAGDEFVMLAPADVSGADAQQQQSQQAQALYNRLDQAMRCVLKLDAGELVHYGGGSVGMVLAKGGYTVEQALREADEAMFADKRLRQQAKLA